MKPIVIVLLLALAGISACDEISVEDPVSPPELSGEWYEKDGVRECDGYLTRRGGEDYCASNVPEDWEAFEYEGRTYYLQPLGQSSRSDGES